MQPGALSKYLGHPMTWWISFRSRVAPLLRWPAGLAAVALVGMAILAGRLIPLFQGPGYELSMLGCAAMGLLGAPFGIAAARGELRKDHPAPAAAWGAASAALAALLAILFLASALQATIAATCRPFAAALFFPTLTLPSALFAAALGVACGFATGGRRAAAGLLYGLAAIASLAWSAWNAYRGPAAFALNPAFGYWPGPIYDNALPIEGRLLFHQLATLTLAVAAVAATSVGVRAVRRDRLLGPALALGLALLAGVAVRAAAVRAGFAVSRAEVTAALGGRRAGDRCVVIFPREKSPEDAERLLRDCEFDAAQVARALEIADPPRATVYVYRSEEEKRRLVGAGATNFTKPWLAEIQITDWPLPHPVLRHELVHALAAGFASGPLRVPARHGFFVSAGLVEGLAVAVDLPHGEWTLHESTRAMRDLGLLPALDGLLGPAGYFNAPPARAYTAAGSFLRYLLDRFGPAQVRALYAGGDFARAFGEPLSALEADWSRFLDGVPTSPPLLAAAELWFRPGGLLVRHCAREVADLESQAAQLAGARRTAEAAALWRRAAALSGEPGDLRAAGDAWRSAGELSCAGDAYREALAAAGGRQAQRASIEEALGDVAWLSGDGAGAAERYRAALALDPERGQARLLHAKVAAATDPALGRAAMSWLLQSGDPSVSMVRLAQSRSPLASYLLGRALLARGAPRLALQALANAVPSALPDASFALEARRARAEAECRVGAWRDGIDHYQWLAGHAERLADRERFADDALRCGFERDVYQRPVQTANEFTWPPGPESPAPVPEKTVVEVKP